MPLISSFEEKILDSILAKTGPGIFLDKYMLKEFAFNRAKRKILQKHPDWNDPKKVDNDQMIRLIELNLQLDFHSGSSQLLRDFIDECNTPPAHEEIKCIKIHEEIKKTIFVEAMPEDHKDKDIDKPVAGVIGRRTRLHLACEQGNYDEVVRLVEVCGAKINVRDASNWTPKDRCRVMNNGSSHARIIASLDQFS